MYFVLIINKFNRRLKKYLDNDHLICNLDAQHCELYVRVNNTSLLYACSGDNKRKAMVTSSLTNS